MLARSSVKLIKIGSVVTGEDEDVEEREETPVEARFRASMTHSTSSGLKQRRSSLGLINDKAAEAKELTAQPPSARRGGSALARLGSSGGSLPTVTKKPIATPKTSAPGDTLW